MVRPLVGSSASSVAVEPTRFAFTPEAAVWLAVCHWFSFALATGDPNSIRGKTGNTFDTSYSSGPEESA